MAAALRAAEFHPPLYPDFRCGSGPRPWLAGMARPRDRASRAEPAGGDDHAVGQQIAATVDTAAELAAGGPCDRGRTGRRRGGCGTGAARLRRGPLAAQPHALCAGRRVWGIGPHNTDQQIYLIDTGAGLALVDPSLDAFRAKCSPSWPDWASGPSRSAGWC